MWYSWGCNWYPYCWMLACLADEAALRRQHLAQDRYAAKRSQAPKPKRHRTYNWH